MSVQQKVKLIASDHLELPAVMGLDMDITTYESLKLWVGDGELILQHEASGLEFVCQLNDQSMSATPASTSTEYALYVLIKEWPIDSQDSTITCSFMKRVKQASEPEDRQYNPWRT